MSDNKRVSIEHLRKCKLWEGSLEQTEDTYCGGPRVIDVKRRIARMEKCDDLTPDEVEYLEALKKTLEEVQ